MSGMLTICLEQLNNKCVGPCPVCDLFRRPEEESVNLSYEQRVVDLADELARQFDGLSISDALARANEIVQSAEEVEAMYLSIIEEDDDQ